MEETVQIGTNINPLALVFLIAMSFVVLSRSRQAAVGALLLTAAFIPLGSDWLSSVCILLSSPFAAGRLRSRTGAAGSPGIQDERLGQAVYCLGLDRITLWNHPGSVLKPSASPTTALGPTFSFAFS